MKYRAILFDLGQTLLEYPGASHEFWRVFLERRLVDMHAEFCQAAPAVEGDVSAFVRQTIDLMWPERKINLSGRSWHFRERLKAVLSHYGCEHCSPNDLERLTDSFYEPIGAGTQRYPETLEVLQAIRAAGLPMAIISNAPWDVPGRLLKADMERWEVIGFFDAFVTSGEAPWRKPNPEFMWAAAQELGVEPEACLVVGDSLKADIVGAKAAGMKCVWVNRDGMAKSDEDPQPDEIVADLTDLLRVISLY